MDWLDHFTKQSSADVEEKAYHLQMLSSKLPPEYPTYIPKVTSQASRKLSQAQGAASSSTTNGEARHPGGTGVMDSTVVSSHGFPSLGFGASDPEGSYLFAAFGLKLAVKECGRCRLMEPLAEFIRIGACGHEHCRGCCEAHADKTVSSTKSSQIECPHAGCPHVFDMDQCRALLSEAGFGILRLRQLEAATPAFKRVYCAFPDCFAFIPNESESQGSESAALDTRIECHSCGRGLCLQCRAPWERECDGCTSVAAHNSFMGTKDCAHEYCTNCCKQHAEGEIKRGVWQIECPHPNCSHNFDIVQFGTLLSEKEFEILKFRQMEAAIPVSERVYCPIQGCGIFVPYHVRPEGDGSACSETQAIACHSCHGAFCLDCNVPWELHCEKCGKMKPHKLFISTSECAHKYCTDCCKQHAERRVLRGNSAIECPHPSCRCVFANVQCRNLLSEASFNILDMKQLEAVTPAPKRTYCPFSDCGVFVPPFNSGSSSPSPDDVFVVCYSCNRGFCLDCKIPWHANKTCAEYRGHVEKIAREKYLTEQALVAANGFERFGEEQASTSGGICRISLLPSLNFQGLTPEECHFRMAESQFFRMSTNRSKKVTQVDFIKNARLEEKFNRKKEEFRQSNVAVEARIVFHGTDANAIDKIANEGFKIGGQGVTMKYGAVYGHGVYTAVNPDISVAYCGGSNMMLLSIAIPGELNKHYNYGGSADVLVIRDVNQLLPRYVVHYS